ncbi:MCP four helix bundle domain-containing protein, partial [Paractinoplanes durhamensis]|uniref:MCP four helix bundle domain-containing protein n=1 Tax=Paractinoplanes durhamensis TaxID=113563 RepID=UPI0031D95DFB
MPRRIQGDSPITVQRNFFEALLGDRSLTIKTVIAAACVAVVALCVAILSINRMSQLNDDLRVMKTDHVDTLQQVANVRGELGAMFRGMLIYYVAAGTAAEKAAQQKQGHDLVDAADTAMDTALGKYDTLTKGSATRQANLTAFVEADNYYRALRNTVLFGEPMAGGYTMPAGRPL